jgi:hypothetical protein
MSVVIQLNFHNDISLAAEATRAIQEEDIQVRKVPQSRNVGGLDLLISLGSAGAFTAFYQILCKILEKNKEKEISIERGGTKVTIKGYSFLDTQQILEKLAPELLPKKS